MKRALLLLFTSNIFYTASASIYLDLDARKGTGINDGKPIVIMSRGNLIVKLPEESAAVPEGTENMKAGEKLVLPMNEKYYEKFLTIFEEAVDNGFAVKNDNSSAYSKLNTSKLPVIPGSISRKHLNGTAYRYLSMVFTEDEYIPGRAAYYVQGTPAKRQCVSSGGGYSCIPGTSLCQNYPVETTCKDVGGSAGYWVPATQDRAVTHRRQLTIDCDDQTYDIKNDGKGWESYWQNSIVSRLAKETCPAINSYPLR